MNVNFVFLTFNLSVCFHLIVNSLKDSGTQLSRLNMTQLKTDTIWLLYTCPLILFVYINAHKRSILVSSHSVSGTF